MATVLRNQTQLGKHSRNAGFALPTILITSIVMLMVLLVSVTSTAAVRTGIKNQYYTQLAQVAGEAGVAYAQACLNANTTNPGAPQWSNANPLMPNTDCSGNVTTDCTASPLAAACSVVRNGDIRSSFSIGMPPTDADGHAITIPNAGYVDILRTSNSAVWRHYTQNTAPTAVVPDLCSGSATSVLGWGNAAIYAPAPRPGFPEPSANQISISTGYVSPGPMYLRKDFSVATDGVYTLNVQADDVANVMVDGALVVTTGGLSTVAVHLGVGCHTIMVKLTNYGLLVNPADLVFSLKLNGTSAPIVVSDRTWRVAAGTQVHFSQFNYYADPTWWTPARDIRAMTAQNSSWTAVSGDASTRYISTTHSYDGSGNYPTNQFILFRDNRDTYATSTMTAQVTMYCDDICYPYLDGNNIYPSGIGATPTSFTVTIAAGHHRFGFLGMNGSGPSAFALSAVNTFNGAIITSTDATWSASSFWSATNPVGAYSYDNTYSPVPDPRNANVLVVAGGGSGGGSTGGGGGGGGVISTTQSFAVGSYSVVVGAGGAAPGNQKPGISGANSSFNGLIAIGGGGGAYTYVGGAGGGQNGGSGGGGQDYGAVTIAGLGTPLQGNPGGALGNASASGGGGAGGAGLSIEVANVGGFGGSGIASNISGTFKYYGGGGGGGNSGQGGTGGGGNGADVGGSGTANTGGGGGGGWSYASGNGGAGGSGVVIIAYPTGSLTTTVTPGAATVTTSGGYTISTFTSSGTFTVTAVN